MSLQLKVFGPAFGEIDASPFCVKAMCLLKLANVEWTARPGSDSRKTPAGKLPVLLDGKQVIHDSDNIRTHLEKNYGADFEQGLTAVQRAQSRTLIRMVEEHLYFCLVYDRWVQDENWRQIKKVFFSDLPPVVRSLVPTIVRRAVLSDLKGQGMGRHSYEDMITRAEHDLEAIETLLGEQRFLFGDQAVAADVSVACILSAISVSPAKNQIEGKSFAQRNTHAVCSKCSGKRIPRSCVIGSRVFVCEASIACS